MSLEPNWRRFAFDFAKGDGFDDTREKAVFFTLNLAREACLVVAIFDGNRGLGENGTRVDTAVDEVNGTSSDADAMCQGLAWRV